MIRSFRGCATVATTAIALTVGACGKKPPAHGTAAAPAGTGSGAGADQARAAAGARPGTAARAADADRRRGFRSDGRSTS